MSKINWKDVLEQAGKDVSEETLEVIDKHKKFLKDIAKREVIQILHYVTTEDSESLTTSVYAALLQQLTDEEFLNIRQKNVEAIRIWAEVDKRKKEIVDDIKSKIEKISAELLLKLILLSV